MNANFLIVGVVRNGGVTLKSSVTNISRAFNFSNKLEWLVIESDSEDGTLEILINLSHSVPNFQYRSLGSLSASYPHRTQRIAFCRNEYLTEIFCNLHYSDIDYVVMVDLDGVNSELTEKAVLSCWNRDDWDVCFANQTGAYYDIWALRHDLWSPNDCWAQLSYLISKGVDINHAKYASVISKMIEIPPNSDWIQVQSAFGGLGIYKKSLLANLAYIGLDKEGSEICEWVDFNKTISKRGHKLFINPALINGGYNEHTIIYKELLESSRNKMNSDLG